MDLESRFSFADVDVYGGSYGRKGDMVLFLSDLSITNAKLRV